MPGYDLDALRAQEFAWAARGEAIYLNHASTGALPLRTARAVEDALHRRMPPTRFPDELIWATLSRARELAARLVGAAPPEIAIATNTSYGINVAAFGLPFAPGDVVVAPAGEFPANVYPWMAAGARRGIVYRQVPPSADGMVDEAAILAALEDPAVRAVALSWVGFAHGYACDLEAIGRACRERGAWFVVDAIQGLGAAPLDVRRCNIDVLSCGAQKWLLGPWGTGFTYVREDLIGRMDPHVIGWTAMAGSDDFARLLDYDLTFHQDARRFESLTLPVHDLIGMNASLELLLELGLANVERHVGALVDLVVRWAEERPDVELATPAAPGRRLGIVSVRVPDFRGASRRLKEAGIGHSVREGLIRLSPHCYNTEHEVRRALEVLDG